MTINPLHHCPACGHKFKDILDFPRVRILEFGRLPIPEAMDSMSAAEAEKHLRDGGQGGRGRKLRQVLADGINMTQVIAQACERSEVQDYFARLAAMPGPRLASQDLMPPFPVDGIFKRAYPWPTPASTCRSPKSEISTETARVTDVEVFCDGPNMGSAGGPTLQSLGAVARLRYEGLLVS